MVENSTKQKKDLHMKRTLAVAASVIIGMLTLVAGPGSPPASSILIGKWAVKIGSYSDTWTFKEGGVVTSQKQAALKGEWRQERNCVLMQWDEVEQGCTTWEAFTMPLNEKGTRGGNWNGQKVSATKLE